MQNRFSQFGLKIPDLLLPNNTVDLCKWAIIACDQYTSQREYWNQVIETVGNAPSTLKLMLPEIYLEEPDAQQRMEEIYRTMQQYLADGILQEEEPGFILVERTTSHSGTRKGLVVLLDLDQYDYQKGATSLIRASESTVIERLPPRITIRQNASLELPHVMVLIDDPDELLLEPLSQKTQRNEILYDFELMMGSGHIKGTRISDAFSLFHIENALSKLISETEYKKKYPGAAPEQFLLYAVGDGNHSLAAAKAHWENIKAVLPSEALENHPARFALVEIVNIHDKGLLFEPIHRVVFEVDPQDLFQKASEYFGALDASFHFEYGGNKPSDTNHLKIQYIGFVTEEGEGIISIENPPHTLAVGSLQNFLDNYLAQNSLTRIDYIHGEDVVKRLGSQIGNMGFTLPNMEKSEFFKTVVFDGTLPRKTFSMGESFEKRFYLESRKII